MASEIRVNSITNRSGLTTTTWNNQGIDIVGIVTASSFSGNLTGNVTGTASQLETNATGANLTLSGNLGVGGTITYEDVARVDATGISTFREGFGVGPLAGIALTAYKDGSIRTTGIVTALSFGSDTNSIFTTGGTERLRITSAGTVQFKGDANPQAEFDRGSANNTNINLKYNGTFTGQISAANADFQLSAVGGSTPISFYTNGSERLRIGTSGQIGIGGANYGSSGQVITSGGSGAAVSWATPTSSLSDQSVQAEMVSDQSMGTNAWNLVKFNAQNWDTGNNYNHATGEWYYQAPSDGKYWYKVSLRMNALGSGKELDVVLYKSTDNGGSYTLQKKTQRWFITPQSAAVVVETTGLISLDEDDRIRAYAWHNHGSNRDLDDNWCLFEVFRLGD